MAMNWKPENTRTTCNKSLGMALSSWSRQQQLALIVCLALLGLLLSISACSKQSPKPPLVSVSDPGAKSASQPAATAIAQTSAASLQDGTQPTPKKKVQRKRSANVTYSDPVFGVSFSYPRKFMLASADKIKSEPVEMDGTPMNFVHLGGVSVATVELPGTLYPGTDFASGFFTVNVNRSISEKECPHFAFVETSDADGEPIDAQKVKVGLANEALKEMEMTSEFEGAPPANSRRSTTIATKMEPATSTYWAWEPLDSAPWRASSL